MSHVVYLFTSAVVLEPMPSANVDVIVTFLIMSVESCRLLRRTLLFETLVL